jgi:SSS family solute:Na+ symporter
MIPALLVFAYLGVVLYIGIFAFRKGKGSGEDYFLAGRSLGPAVFLLSLFGTNMTAFSILGSSGMSYHRGLGVFGLMASSSALVIPLTIWLIGTRLWSLGKRFGHMTQVQYLRDRWDCGAIGTFYFALTAAMLIPYIVIAVMGGGDTLETVSGGKVPFAAGGALVALVVMGYVFFGGMRGTAWVNAFQTTLFLCFGTAAFVFIARGVGGMDRVMEQLGGDPKTAHLLTRERIPPREFVSYLFLPLSSIMFPHVAITCLTAKSSGHFRKTVILYPLCILALWAPAVYLGVVAAAQFPGLKPGETDDVLIRLLTAHAGPVLSGLLGAGIMACVMASDSQIMALSTMFTEDVFVHYGGKERFGDRAQVWTGRAFVVGIAALAYGIGLALKDRAGIFDVAVRFAFTGYAALAPVMLAALFWKRSTKWGALAAGLWALAWVVVPWILFEKSAPGKPFPFLPGVLARTPGSVTVFGFLPVVPAVLGSALLMGIVSLLTPPPSRETLDRYFPPTATPEGPPSAAPS